MQQYLYREVIPQSLELPKQVMMDGQMESLIFLWVLQKIWNNGAYATVTVTYKYNGKLYTSLAYFIQHNSFHDKIAIGL